MQQLSIRLFLKTPDGKLGPSNLVVEPPSPFAGHPGVFQAKATFPGVLPDDGMSSRDQSNLMALIRLLNSVEQFCKNFEKSGGKLYYAMHDDQDKPFLEEPVSVKRFFHL